MEVNEELLGVKHEEEGKGFGGLICLDRHCMKFDWRGFESVRERDKDTERMKREAAREVTILVDGGSSVYSSDMALNNL